MKFNLAGKKWMVGGTIIGAILAAALLFVPKQQAPQVTFSTIKGEKISVDSLRGKVVLVNFWATDCPGCIHEMPKLIQTHNKYNSRGFETIAVAMSYDPPNYVVNYTEKNALPFKIALDVQGEIAKAFGNVRLTPTSFVIDKQGHIVQQTIGEPDFTKLHTLIEAKLQEKT